MIQRFVEGLLHRSKANVGAFVEMRVNECICSKCGCYATSKAYRNSFPLKGIWLKEYSGVGPFSDFEGLHDGLRTLRK